MPPPTTINVDSMISDSDILTTICNGYITFNKVVEALNHLFFRAFVEFFNIFILTLVLIHFLVVHASVDIVVSFHFKIFSFKHRLNFKSKLFSVCISLFCGGIL